MARSVSGGALRPETKGQAEPARTGRGPSSVRCRDQSGGEERRAISVPLDRVTSGQSGAVEDNEVGWSTEVTGDDLSNSQSDSADSIPVTRSTVKMRVRGLSPKLDLAELGASRTVRGTSVPLAAPISGLSAVPAYAASSDRQIE